VPQYHHCIYVVIGQTRTQFADVNFPAREVEFIDLGDAERRCFEGLRASKRSFISVEVIVVRTAEE